MIRSVVFVLAFLAAATAFGQTVSEPLVPPQLSTFFCNGCWRCEGSGAACYSDVVTGHGDTCAAAEKDCEAKLDIINPGNCSPGNDIPIKHLFECQIDKDGFSRLHSVAASGTWTVRLTYQFGNGERMSRSASGCSYCEAYQSAWSGILRLASRKCGVCCCTGKCEIAEGPAGQCGCQSSPCCQQVDVCHNNRQRIRVRCR